VARGRKPKPTAQKELAGNPGKRVLNKREPKYDELESADAPDWLDQMAKDAWSWYAPRLIAQKILTQADLHNLEAFCSSYSRWRQGEDHIAKNGVILETEQGLKKNPASTIITEALRQMATFGALLGLDPSSRQRLTAPKGPGGNPFANL
jgi:P27 family predicted phage terminase small subunit